MTKMRGELTQEGDAEACFIPCNIPYGIQSAALLEEVLSPAGAQNLQSKRNPNQIRARYVPQTPIPDHTHLSQTTRLTKR